MSPRNQGQPYGYQFIGRNKTVGLIFFNPSPRTRLSSGKAAYNPGAHAWVLNADSWTLEVADDAVKNGGMQEHIKDAIAAMSKYCDVLGVRTFPTLTNRDQDYPRPACSSSRKPATAPSPCKPSCTSC